MLITHADPRARGRYVPARGPVFVAIARKDERHILKDAGFRWDPDMLLDNVNWHRGYWWTADVAVAARLAPYADETVGPMVRPYAESRRESRLVAADIDIPCPPGLAYMPFQKAGIAYALDRESVLIGDEMGLGKTIQAIGVMNADPPARTLIICPASLKANWRRELTRWLVDPLISIGIASGSYLPHSRVVIINPDILTRHAKALGEQRWDLLIVDECHQFKNPTAQRSRVLYGGDNAEERKTFPGIRAARKLFLTGTPIVNRPLELWPIIRHLDPERWRRKGDFQWRYTVQGSPNSGRNLEELQDILRSTIMVRRLKAEVLTELPPKRRQILELPASAEQRRLLQAELAAARAGLREHASAPDVPLLDAGGTDAGWAEIVSRLVEGEFGSFEELSKLRHQTAVVKAPSVVQHVRDMLDEVPKVVVFAHHLDVLDILHEGLRDLGAVCLDGRTPIQQRQAIVDQFQNRDECRVFIAGIQAAGVGITLTAANTVVFAELDWVPGNMKQAEDRCHRIGSEHHESILIQHVVLEESLDVYMAQILAEKLATIERAMDKEVAPLVPEVVVKDAPEVGSLASVTTGVRPRCDADYPELPGGLAQARALHTVARLLAGLDPDYAGLANGVGFNKMDGPIGHSLACWHGDLTPRQAVTARKLFRKYHNQLPPELVQLAFA